MSVTEQAGVQAEAESQKHGRVRNTGSHTGINAGECLWWRQQTIWHLGREERWERVFPLRRLNHKQIFMFWHVVMGHKCCVYESYCLCVIMKKEATAHWIHLIKKFSECSFTVWKLCLLQVIFSMWPKKKKVNINPTWFNPGVALKTKPSVNYVQYLHIKICGISFMVVHVDVTHYINTEHGSLTLKQTNSTANFSANYFY